MASMIDNSRDDIPQWKKDLILRIRNKSRGTAVESEQQLVGTPRSSSAIGDRSGQQPNPTCCIASVTEAARQVSGAEQCKRRSPSTHHSCNKMVQERCWMDSKQVSACDIVQENGTKELDTDNPDEFHYGPGIVNKLKNRYLSLTLRENNAKIRSSILPLRKATSLENILDDDDEPQPKYVSTSSRIFEPKKDDFGKRNVTNRYRNATRGGGEQKRARSVETISRTSHEEKEFLTDRATKRESFHEEVLIITEGNDANFDRKRDRKIVDNAINRPKRITPVISESEKPPADLIQQAKKIFEGKPEKRTKAPQPTGEVAAKVATYKSIIVQSCKATSNKKPAVKQKPVALHNEKNRLPAKSALEKKLPVERPNSFETEPQRKIENGDAEPEHLIKPSQLLSHSDSSWISRQNSSENVSLLSPIPDISRVNFTGKTEGDNKELKNGYVQSETPDLLIHSSPTHLNPCKIAVTKTFIKREIDHSNRINSIKRPTSINYKEVDVAKIERLSPIKSPLSFYKANSPRTSPLNEKSPVLSPTRPELLSNKIHSPENQKNSNTFTYNLSKSNVIPNHLPQSAPSIQQLLGPLKVEVNGEGRISPSPQRSPIVSSPRSPPLTIKTKKPPVLQVTNNENSHHTPTKVEQNFKSSPAEPSAGIIKKNVGNSTKAIDSALVNDSIKANGVKVKGVEEIRTLKPKRPPQDQHQNSIVFKFTDRKDVPDYVGNDGRIRSAKIERPKVGEGGIILLPGVSLDESVVDDDEDWLLLAGPPSPCDVVFVNDNILIDGKSSLKGDIKKSVAVKLKFVESLPEVFEYPSEDSFMEESTAHSSPTASPGHTVPSLTGSTLANYIPKAATEDFKLGVTRLVAVAPPSSTEQSKNEEPPELILQEASNPIVFSAGTNADILF